MSLNLDADLFFLEEVPSSELDPLVRILLYDGKRKRRLLSGLAGSDAYRQHRPDHHRYVREIAEEIQRYGSNTLATQAYRPGCGLTWKEVLSNLCSRLELPAGPLRSAERMELDITQMLLNTLLEGAGEEQKKALITYFGIDLRLLEEGQSMYYDIRPVIISNPELPSILTGLVAALDGADTLMKEQPSLVVNAVSRIVSKAGRLPDDHEEEMALPFPATALALKGLRSAVSKAEPRWDIILPCAVHIACLRSRGRKLGWNLLRTDNEGVQRGLEIAQAFAINWLKSKNK